MKKIIGFILILPTLWVALTILMLKISYLLNKNKEEWHNIGLNEEDERERFSEKYMRTFMFGSALWITFIVGWYLLFF